MCGICGIFHYDNQNPVDRRIIREMTDSIVHRGPDDEGFFFTDRLGFGFRRLSIIDLSGGHQPMSNRDGSIRIVFNGEIYNFPELKHELESFGFVFDTKSDTEVIIHGYEKWGDDVLNHLNGMFGFALWDNRNKRLLLARDRMGIKIIYYHTGNGKLVFGSEIRAVSRALQDKPQIDPLSLNLFLRYRYTPSPLTIFSGIKKLAPGTCLIAENGSFSVKRWWQFEPEPDHGINEAKAIATLDELYRSSMKRHLLSDVPVGLLLSGGVDSALLLSLMNLFGKEWKTFSVGFGNRFKDDELDDARKSAAIFGAHHGEIRLDKQTFEESLPAVIRSLEEPIASASIVPMYHVCKKAAGEVKVALIGQGPDELFGGYTRHWGLRYGSHWRRIPGVLRYAIKNALKHLPRNEAIKRGLFSLDIPDRLRRYQNVFSLDSAESVDSLFRNGILPENPGDEIFTCWNDMLPLMTKTEELGGFQFLEIRSSLPDELLMYADKLSMAHSLELRVPYLDREIVQFAETVPDNIKMKWGMRKLLHKKIAARFLPDEIINRKKRAFSLNVVDAWFTESIAGKMTGYFMDTSSLMYKYLNRNKVITILNEHRSGRHDRYKILFSIIVFEEWLRAASGDRTF